jgi:hypothetical protein
MTEATERTYRELLARKSGDGGVTGAAALASAS